MDDFLPTNFFQAVGGGLAIVAVGSALLSLCPCLRVHTLKLLAIFLVTSLALFANHVSTYFVAIFVIATAVTEIEFLQNLAAIIRGNKEYFEYKKGQLSPQDKLERIKKEVGQAEAIAASAADSANQPTAESESSKQPTPQLPESSKDEVSMSQPSKGQGSSGADSSQESVESNTVNIRSVDAGAGLLRAPSRDVDLMRIYNLESKALDQAELIFDAAIERGVLLRGGKGKRLELDGFIPAGNGMPEDIAFEVKYVRTGRNLIMLLRFLEDQTKRMKMVYKEITGKTLRVHIVLIFEAGVILTLRQRAEIEKLGSDVSIFQADQL
ncbi:hypothetical protein HBO40_00255 [Pseudomonas protegens]|uniref:hypothetical protein n=1 Tax=Pseudomonas protegens TaxID=380021 RepID=UPI0014759D47|nr:hypothetical protein [Pseudomonas protegens]NMZ26032.1 hypothetical protein [Pseudomonas protegens]NMZ84647.1 hypothetical protein [Pseudomonas protegens]